MGMNATPSADRIHIGIFGKRNAGKSSLINALTGQDLAIVSEIKGTTTDPVSKAMELLPLGPVVMIDTPGLDDEGELGAKRIKKSYQVLNKTDIALLVVDASCDFSKQDQALLDKIKKKKIPYLIIYNKSDLSKDMSHNEAVCPQENSIKVSSVTGENIQELKERIGQLVPEDDTSLRLVGDLIAPMDVVVLVVPIDSAAPKGRIILPQQQTIRDLLESDAVSVVVKDTEFAAALKKLGVKPKLVITDSQAFARVSSEIPDDILLTSFSILFARYKGELHEAVKSVRTLDKIKDGDKILIAEGCTHHRQCDDIGTVKLPRWIRQYTGKQVEFQFVSGQEFPEDLSGYKLVVHCGGCMLNTREMKYRIACSIDQNVPITNYGILIAYTKGILKRSIKIFPHIAKELE